MVRTRANRAALNDETCNSDEELASHSAACTDLTPQKKRKRTDSAKSKPKAAPTPAAKQQTRRKGKGSKLKQLPLLPLELLNLAREAVFTFVQPYDLLRLCRTTKTLRTMLLSRDSRPTWTASLASMSELPECPSDISEPAFTQLMFDECCNDCYLDDKVRILWMLRIQLCEPCLSKRSFARVTDINFGMQYPRLSQIDVRTVLRHYSEYSWNNNDRSKDLFLIEDCQSLEDQFKFLTQDGEEYRHLVESRQKAIQALKKHANQCTDWRRYNLRKGVRRQELKEAKDWRKAAIMARLDLAGYGQISKWIMEGSRYPFGTIKTEFLKMKMWKDPKDLTDRIWTNAQPAAIAFLDSQRPAYEAARWQFLVAFRTQLLGIAAEVVWNDTEDTAGISVPRLADLKVIPAIRLLLERPLDEDGHDTVEPEEIVAALREIGPQALVNMCTNQCHQLMLEKIRARGDGKAHLELRTSLFVCSDSSWGCRSGLMTHRQLATHRCWRTSRGTKWGYGITYEESWGWADLERLDRLNEAAGRISDGAQDSTGSFQVSDTPDFIVTW